MSKTRRKWSKDIKLRMLAEVRGGSTVAGVARKYGVAPVQIYQWQRQHKEYGDKAFQGNGKAYSHEAEVAALQRKIGELTMEIDLLKKLHHRLMNPELD